MISQTRVLVLPKLQQFRTIAFEKSVALDYADISRANHKLSLSIKGLLDCLICTSSLIESDTLKYA